MGEQFKTPADVMQRALGLAAKGLGLVEPNPPVGAVIVDDELRLLGEGFHRRFGEHHAEINALNAAGERASGATLFVTLEPCSHWGKTGPCTRAIVDAGIRRVVLALEDPFPHASRRGIAELEAAGISVEEGLLAEEARRLMAPFFKLVTTGRPYVHAKWAMSLDGKIAASGGESKWISGERSREIVHRLRGRMDAILVGAGTARIDDPALVARPPGPRTAMRIVVDSSASLSEDCRLLQIIGEAPVLIAAGESAPEANVARLQDAGAEVLRLPEMEYATTGVRGSRRRGPTAPGESGLPNRPPQRKSRGAFNGSGEDLNAATVDPPARWPDLRALMDELGRRKMTNVLVEGGSRLFGSLFDQDLVDEVHVFVAARLIGGSRAVTPVAGLGRAAPDEWLELERPESQTVDGDLYIHGPLRRPR